MDAIDILLEHKQPDSKHSSAWIEYALPRSAKISLEMYDAGGEKLATLLEEKKAAGSYSFDLNAGKPKNKSGSYFCRFAAYDDAERLFYVNVKKLTL